MNRAQDDEMTFVLLGRDAAAPAAIRAWIAERIRSGKNRTDDGQIVEARACAEAVERELRKRTAGLYSKFLVRRIDARDAPGEKHHGCYYFVLDMTHDTHAKPALLAYADSCQAEYPALASDLRKLVETLQT